MPDPHANDDADVTRSGRMFDAGDTPTGEALLESEFQLVEILDRYLAALKAGTAPSREELIARHPQLAERLEACLAGLEFIHRAESAELAGSQRLGDFQLLREVGRGGMGAVFEARQMSLGRRVAVKVLRFGTVSDPEAVDRFRREAETVAQLHHTNIVPIFYVGSEHGVNYYAMQFIEGRSLAEVLAERGEAIEPLEVVEWGLQAAEALAHAHQRGVIHRDVKPSNLLLDGEGRIWLTDFGLAKRMDDVTLSMTGALLGTPRYMSPEQASATRNRIDHRTDLYSLGATLYELATGQPVFSADTPHQVIGQILSQEPTPPRRIVPALPRDLETVLLRCLAKEPERRYPSARALADDLRAVLDGRAIQSRRAGLTERAMKWARRHRRNLALTGGTMAATLGIAAAVFLAVLWYQYRQRVFVTLATDRPPLAAEIRDETGRLVARQTVPTQQPMELPAGAYRMRVSGDQRLSETYGVQLVRGQYPKYTFNLDESLLTAPLETKRSYRIVSADGGALGVVLDDDGLRCWDFGRGALRWTASLHASDQPLLQKTPGWVWPWNDLARGMPNRGWGAFDLRPFVTESAADLNGDGKADLVLAARHQACVLAVSGQDGNLLWVAARGRDLEQPVADQQERSRRGVISGTVTPPTSAEDIDGDGVGDFIAVFADEHDDRDGVDRWLEAISGRSGVTVWRRDLDAGLFALPDGRTVPESYRWFTGSDAASTWTGGSREMYDGHVFLRDRGRLERTGYYYGAPSRPMLLSWRKGGQRTPHVSLVAGSQALAFDLKTGEPAEPPLEAGIHPGLPPAVADVNGDGADEIILVEELPGNMPGAPGSIDRVRLSVVSLAERRPLCSRDLLADWPQTEGYLLPAPRWPVVADLESDGQVEIIVPNGNSQSTLGNHPPWGELEVLEGATGAVRWRRRLKTMDQQVDHFLAGPDVDGDGTAEVFAVTLWSGDFDLYVDALSGRDGRSLWVERHRLREINESARYHLAPPRWWQAGGDGWPTLVALVHPGSTAEKQPIVCTFSAGTGETTRIGRGLIEPQTADGDGDGIEDLFALAHASRDTLDAGGTVVAFRGQRRELWRTIGNAWSVTADLNGDGMRDLVRAQADGSLVASSSREGQPLWSARPLGTNRTRLSVATAISRPNGLTVPGYLADDFAAPPRNSPHTGDWDRDGTIDLLVYADREGTDRSFSPLAAVSGRAGRTLWSADIALRSLHAVLALDVPDLDGDGLAEVVWVAASDWGYPQTPVFHAHYRQLQIAVISGKDGSVVWSHPLTQAYGLTPQTNSPPFDFDGAGWVGLGYGDLDADGALDVLVPGEAESPAGKSSLELRALGGKTGQLLWKHPLPPPREVYRAFSDLPPPAVVDLDADGRPEVLLLSYEMPAGTQAVLRALAGADGHELWSKRFDVSGSSGQIHADAWRVRQRPRPMVLRASSGPPRICLNLWDGPERVVVLDATGETVSDFRLATDQGFHRGDFRLWPCDTDGDGSDELLLANRDHLMAIRPDRPDEPLWQRPVDHLWTDEIEGILPDDARGQIVLVRHVYAPGSLYALDAATGKTVWTAAAPTPRIEGHDTLFQPDQVAVLSRGTGQEPPSILFQHSFVACVREATSAGTASNDGTRVAARLGGGSDDPRRLRPLPWCPPDVLASEFPTEMAWGFFYSVMLLYIPGVYLVRLVARRQWSLRRFLLLPAAAAAPMIAVATDASRIPLTDLSDKLAVAVFLLPAVIAIVQWVRWTIARRWWMAMGWALATVVSSAIFAALALAASQWTPETALEAGERYAWDGWYFIWLYGAQTTAWALAIWLLLSAAARAVVGGWRRLRRGTAKPSVSV